MSHDYMNFGSGPENEDKAETEPEPVRVITAEAPTEPTAPAQHNDPIPAARQSKPSSPASAEEKRFYELVDGPYMETLIGNRYGAYRKAWIGMFKSARSIGKMTFTPSLHISAILFTTFWATYRGVWSMVGIHLVLSYILTAYDLLTNEIHLGLSWGIGALTGAFANGLYFQKMRKEAADLQNRNADPHAALGRKAGRGSWGRMIGGILAFYVVVSIGQNVEEKILQGMGYNVSIERTYVEPIKRYLQESQARQSQGYYR